MSPAQRTDRAMHPLRKLETPRRIAIRPVLVGFVLGGAVLIVLTGCLG